MLIRTFNMLFLILTEDMTRVERMIDINLGREVHEPNSIYTE